MSMERLTPRGMLIPSVLLLVVALIVTAMAGCGAGTPSAMNDLIYCQANRAEENARQMELTRSDRYIVKLASGTGGDATASSAARIASGSGATEDGAGAEYVRELFRRSTPNALSQGIQAEPQVRSISENTYAVRLDAEEDVASTMDAIGTEPDVAYVEPDYVVQALEPVGKEEDVDAGAGFASEPPDAEETASAASLTDPMTDKQWAHQKIGSFGAWQVTPGSKRVIVAVVDSGVDYTHPDLAGNMWHNPKEIPGNKRDDDGNGYVDDIHGWDFKGDDDKPLSDEGRTFHGTHVAGTIGAVGGNKIGITGHSPNVQIMAIRFLGDNGGFTSDAVRGINYAVKHGARVINNSWGSGNVSQALKDAIESARQKGVLFVAAAGNSGNNIATSPMYPAAYPHDNILVVGATDKSDNMPSWSNYSTTRVDVGAPGKSIYSTRNGGKYASLNGTSMATPLVSGVAALVASIRPDYGYAAIKRAIMGTVDKSSSLSKRVATGGRVNAQRAVAAAATGTPVRVPAGGSDGGDPCAGI